MSANFDEILLELGYKFGIVDLSKENQINELIEILKSYGVDSPNEVAQKARVYFSYLNEDVIVKNRETGNVYSVKKMNPKTHIKPTPKEIEKAKKANGGVLPKGEPKPVSVKGKSVFGKGKGGNVFEPKGGLNLKPEEVKKKVEALKHVIAKDFSPELKKDKATINNLVSGFEKMISGGKPNAAELKALKNHVALKDKEGEATLYIANKTPGDFKKHKKVEFGGSPEKQQALKDLVDKAGLQSTKAQEGALGRKEMVANKISPKRKIVKPEEQKDGSVKIEGVVHKPMPIPPLKELTAELKKNGVENPEEEAKLTVNSIKRYNKQIEMLKKTKDFEVVDFGDTSTPEGRKKAFENVKKMMTSRFEQLLKNQGALSKENKQILEDFNKIKFNDKGSNPNFEKDIDTWFSKMTLNKDFRTAAPDLLELMVFSKMMGRGYHAFLPASETFKVSDVVAFKEPDFKIGKGKSPAKQVADNFKMIKTSLIMVGGSSVKFAEGGAGQSDSKVEQTEYKNKETKQRLGSLLQNHQFVYGKGKDGKYPPSEVEISKKEKEIASHLKWALSQGIISKQEYASILEEGKKQAENIYATAIRNGVGPLSKAEAANYKRLIAIHTLSGSTIERINNNDTDFNYFSNERTRVNERTGEVRNEELDGVTKKCCMGWSYNPGFKFSEYGGKKWMTPNNVNPSHIVPCEKRIK